MKFIKNVISDARRRLDEDDVTLAIIVVSVGVLCGSACAFIQAMIDRGGVK